MISNAEDDLYGQCDASIYCCTRCTYMFLWSPSHMMQFLTRTVVNFAMSKPLPNELNITYQVIAWQLPDPIMHCTISCDVITVRYQGKRDMKLARKRCVEIVFSIHQLIMSWKKYDSVLDELFMCPLECYYLCLFPSCLRNTGNKHKNNTLVNAKQFVSPWHVPFYIYPIEYARGSVVRFVTVLSVIITMTSLWARWRLKSPASRLFSQPLIQSTDHRKHQSSASLAFVRGIHRCFHLMTS